MLPSFDLMYSGLLAAMGIGPLSMILLGTIIGIIFGALPGLTASMAIAVLIPVTFGMDAASGLLLLASAYCGAMYGGSISASLLNTPGTVAAAATSLEGYPMVLKGRGGEALGIAAFASWGGGTISVLALLFFGPPIARMALNFGPAEYATLGLLGLVLIVSVSMKSLVKGLLSGLLGLLIGTVGMDAIIGHARFSYGNPNLYSGIDLIPALIGLFSISQVLVMTETTSGMPMAIKEITGKVGLKLNQVKGLIAPIVRSSVIGTVVGALPGAGATIATFMAYDVNKRSLKDQNECGTGLPSGIASTESANNAVTGGAFTIMLTLGIPGNEATAIMLGGLMILGLQPGPNFFIEGSHVAYSFIMGLFIANFVMLILGLSLSRQIAKLIKSPTSVLIVGIIVLSVIGSYAIHNNMFDVTLLFILGILGYLMKKTGFSPVPVILGMILGPIIEANMMRAILISGGNWSTFITRPLSLTFLILTVVILAYPFITERMEKRRVNNTLKS